MYVCAASLIYMTQQNFLVNLNWTSAAHKINNSVSLCGQSVLHCTAKLPCKIQTGRVLHTKPILSKCCWQLLSILKPSYQTFSDINFHYKFGTLFRRCTAFVCVCVFGVGGSFLMRTKFWKCVTVLTKHTHTQRHCQTTSMQAGFCCSYCCCCHCSCFSLMF